jgi:hypothetical protein
VLIWKENSSHVFSISKLVHEKLKTMALVLYTELKYKRIDCYGLSFLTYTGEINEENYPRVIPVEIEQEEEDTENSAGDENLEVVFELDIEYLKSLDPKNWKDQDHYAVLGLQKAR